MMLIIMAICFPQGSGKLRSKSLNSHDFVPKLSQSCPEIISKFPKIVAKLSQSCLKITQKLPQDTTRHCIHCFKIAQELEIFKYVWHFQFYSPKTRRIWNLKLDKSSSATAKLRIWFCWRQTQQNWDIVNHFHYYWFHIFVPLLQKLN